MLVIVLSCVFDSLKLHFQPSILFRCCGGSYSNFYGLQMILNMVQCRLNSNGNWSEVDILKLAAGVESSTIHPIGKAIVEAAKAQNCLNVKVYTLPIEIDAS